MDRKPNHDLKQHLFYFVAVQQESECGYGKDACALAEDEGRIFFQNTRGNSAARKMALAVWRDLHCRGTEIKQA